MSTAKKTRDIGGAAAAGAAAVDMGQGDAQLLS
jgi:hypothetical protein